MGVPARALVFGAKGLEFHGRSLRPMPGPATLRGAIVHGY